VTIRRDMEAAQSSRRSLAEIFVERGLISEVDLERALAEQFATKRRLADILVRRGLVTGSDITSALNEQLAALHLSDGHTESDAPVEFTLYGHEDVDESAAAVTPAPILYSVEEEGWDEVVFDATASEPPSSDGEPGHDLHLSGEREAPPADLGGLAPEADAPVEPTTLIQETDDRRHAMELQLATLGPILEGLERVQADLIANELCSPLLAHELTATEERLITRGDELSAEIAMLKETREEIERTAGLLEELRTELAGKVHELAELRATAAIWTGRVADVEAEVESLTTRANEAAHDLNALAVTRVATPAIEAVTETHAPSWNEAAAPARPGNADGHILFLPAEDGYELVDHVGASPRVGEVIDVRDQSWVVTKIGRSPLPFDDRDCAFLTAS
jgi:hypothetical protein